MALIRDMSPLSTAGPSRLSSGPSAGRATGADPEGPAPVRDCGAERRVRYCAGAGASRTATDVIGWAGGLAPSEPKNGWSEKLKMPPSSATIR